MKKHLISFLLAVAFLLQVCTIACAGSEYIQITDVEISTNSATVHWKGNKDGPYVLKLYNISNIQAVYIQALDYYGNSFTYTDLLPNTEYRLAVMADWFNDNTIRQDSVDIRTLSTEDDFSAFPLDVLDVTFGYEKNGTRYYPMNLSAADINRTHYAPAGTSKPPKDWKLVIFFDTSLIRQKTCQLKIKLIRPDESWESYTSSLTLTGNGRGSVYEYWSDSMYMFFNLMTVPSGEVQSGDYRAALWIDDAYLGEYTISVNP